MTDLLARLSALLVEPRDGAVACDARRAGAQERPRRRVACAAASVVVLGDARAARAGTAVAAALARGARAPYALLCTWGAPRAGVVLPSLPASAAAAAKLRARGQQARAAGRVVTVSLPEDEDEAVAACGRAAAAVCGQRDVPVVLALCAARGDALDAGLDGYDVALVVSADGGDPLADVAVARLAERHPGLSVTHAEVAASSRLAAPPRAAVRAVLEALR